MIGLDTNILRHGTSLVLTDTLELLLSAAPPVLSDRFIVAVDGPPGCGKTTALRTFIERQDLPVHAISLDPGSTDKDVVRQLYDVVVGHPVRGTTRRVDLMAELRVTLAGSGCLVVIDEAQNGRNEALEMIRHLHMDPTANWQLALAGVGLKDRLERERKLASRIGHWALMRPLAGADLLDVLPRLHPALAATDPDLLLAADRVACKGVLREWVKVAALLDRIAPEVRVSREDLESVITAITGTPTRLPTR